MEEIKEKQIKIIHEPSDKEPFLLIYKNAGLPTAPLSQDDKDNALSIAGELFPQILKIKGIKDIEYGLIHRIDTQTKGLVIIAASQDFYDYIQNEQKEGRFIKTYRARCEENLKNVEILKGFPEIDLNLHYKLLKNQSVNIQSYFRHYGEKNSAVRPVTDSSSKIIKNKVGKLKAYSTKIKLSKTVEIEGKTEYDFLCSITSGFRHQVRAHLCWLGFPIIGDKLYNSSCPSESSELQFEANSLTFTWKGKEYNFKA